jgi:hypothetical protein
VKTSLMKSAFLSCSARTTVSTATVSACMATSSTSGRSATVTRFKTEPATSSIRRGRWPPTFIRPGSTSRQTAHATPSLGAWAAGGAVRNASAVVGPLFFLMLIFRILRRVIALSTADEARGLPNGPRVIHREFRPFARKVGKRDLD